MLRNKIWKFILNICGFILTVILFLAMPYLVVKRPHISEIFPHEIMQNSLFNDNKSLMLYTDDIDNIIAFYVNEIWEPDVRILSAEEGKLEIKLPDKYYNDEGQVNIAYEVKKNSEMTAKSNTVKLMVLSDESIKIPTITTIEPESLGFDGQLFQRVVIHGENIGSDSRLYIDDRQLDAQAYDGYIEAYLPYSYWCTKDSDTIAMKIVQSYNGYLTSKQSENYSLHIENNVTEPDNEDTMIKYLNCIKNDNYIVIFSVKDESTQAVTDGILGAMSELGLQKPLTGYGVHQSYIAVIDNEEVLHEDISDDPLVYECVIDGVSIHVESENFNVGNNSKIIIDNVDYSVNEQGLNIVVYDKARHCVADSVCFNTYSGLGLSKKQ